MFDNTPFFIVGAGRSGTTLLRLILAGHSRLHIPPETWFVRSLVEELPLAEVLSKEQVDKATNLMINDYRWPDMEITAEQLRDRAGTLASPTLVDIIDIVYRHHLALAGKQRFGDKTPVYIHIVPELATLYPGARFIHLIRDGRDVAISNIDVGWDRYYEQANFEWTQAMAKRREYSDSPFASAILDVRYEDLVTDLPTIVRKICLFLGEAFEPAMLDWQHLVTLIPERERHIHGKLARPVSSDAVAVWRRKLNAAECFAVEACLHKDLRQLGYELRFASSAYRPLLDTVGRLLYASAPLLARTSRYLKRHNLLAKTAYF
jgi:hypothetical protein